VTFLRPWPSEPHFLISFFLTTDNMYPKSFTCYPRTQLTSLSLMQENLSIGLFDVLQVDVEKFSWEHLKGKYEALFQANEC